MTFSDDEFAGLRQAYWKHVAAEDLVGRAPADLAGAVRSHLALAEKRPQGTARVRVFTPLIGEAGWDAEGRSVVEIVTDDMPFLVDSVSQELTRTDRAIFLVVHPQIVVRRDIAGTLLGPADRGAPDLTDTRESWMHVEIDRLSDAEAVEVETNLRRVLDDVRSAVEDWQKMGEAVLRAADDLLGGAGTPDLVALHLPRLPRVRADRRPQRRRVTRGAGHRPGHPARGLGHLRLLRGAGRAGTRASPRPQPADRHQVHLALDRAPRRLPGLRRREAVRRKG
jgi:hypothetical protein